MTIFRGRGAGKFAAGTFLQAKDGGNLNAGPKWASDDKPEMDSLAASPALVDWEGDGDLDLLVGNIAGRVILITNEGTAKQAAWGAKRAIQAAGSDLRVNGGDAGPEIADWDGDGRWDLLVGAGDGAVLWYRNEGTPQAPALAAGVALVAGSDHESGTLAHGATPTHSGMRAKPTVSDWNCDGLPDLIVGDFLQQMRAEPVLTAEQVAERDRLRARRDELSSSYPQDGDEAAQQAWSEEYGRIYEQLQPLEAGQDLHGFVWVYLRRPGTPAAAPAAAR